MSLMERIGECRAELAQWKRANNSNSDARMKDLRVLLEKEVEKIFPNQREMQRLRKEITIANRKEEAFWKNKSKEQWLRLGDTNTTYFHNCVKGRKAQNRLLMLKDEFGREQFSEGSKGNIAAEYFQKLFSSTNPQNFENLLEGMEPRVTEMMNTLLTAPVSNEEIKNAAFSIKGGSSPGPDGFTGCFYQRFWSIVGPSIILEVKNFFRSSILPHEWNHTQLCLLPKVTQPSRMTDMRPISLCAVHYKIVSKVLCGRLKQILPDIISDTQGAFVSERLITDNILVAHELIHALRTNGDISEDFMAIKTDMSKAYDRVEWNFLEELMRKMGFNERWITWIMVCIRSVTYTVLINGRPHGFIKPERGIRQGDPLSPFIFIICAEALVHSLNLSERQGKLNGISLAPQGPAVHHLLFADDSLLLCKASCEESMEINRCLKEYGDASGQVINTQKSSIIFGSKVNEATKTMVKGVLGIEKEGGEGTYLGLPECFSGSKRKLLSFIQEKLQGRLKGWFAQSLSQGGKEILMKSVALAQPVYAMQCFKLPEDVCKKLTSAMTEFWWSNGRDTKKIPWVAWTKLCKSKREGGLGFHDIKKFNQTLLCKQAWRILDQPQSLVSRVLKSKYFKNGSFLECGVGQRPSYAWRSILHGRELLSRGLLKTIGNGKTTKVWLEKWILDEEPRIPLCSNESHIQNINVKVADMIDEETGAWMEEIVRALFIEDDAERILKMKTSLHVEDSFIWSFSKNGVYNSQSGYKLLEKGQEPQANTSLSPLEQSLWTNLWKIKTMPKIKHFLWKALAGALAVLEGLRVRGMATSRVCSACNLEPETVCHVLFFCPVAEYTWTLSRIPLPPMGLSKSSVFLNFHLLWACLRNENIGEELRNSIPWILWEIWKARNLFVFEGKRTDGPFILAKAQEDAGSWFEANKQTEQFQPGFSSSEVTQDIWIKPPTDVVKCNVASSWINSRRSCGVAWIARDHYGKVLSHSRCSFSAVETQLELDMKSIKWAVEGMRGLRYNNIIFESTSTLAVSGVLQPRKAPMCRNLIAEIQEALRSLGMWKIQSIEQGRNQVAYSIALSVTETNRHQSYIAIGGPSWLSTLINSEAQGSSSES